MTFTRVKTIETMSEATLQLALNGMVIKEFGLEFEEWFGIKYSIQAVSGILSMISIYKCLVDRFSFIRNGRDMGPVSKEFLKAMADLAFPILTIFSIMLFTWSNTSITPELSFVLVICLHPLVAFIFIGLAIALKNILEHMIMLVGMTYITIAIFLGSYSEAKEEFNKNYNSSLIFNLCLQDTRRNNSNINLGDYLSSEQVSWNHWLWIFVVLTLIHSILSQIATCSTRFKFNYLKKYFGRLITLIEFYRGPMLPESQETQDQVHQDIELDQITQVNAIGFDSNSVDFSESQEASPFIQRNESSNQEPKN